MEERPEEPVRPHVSDDFFHGDIERGIERMRMRLLDLSNRNRLLNFRHTKRSSLQVVGEAPESIYPRLRDGTEFFFKAVPKPDHENRDVTARAHAEQLGLPTEIDLPPFVPGSGQQTGHGLQTLHFSEDLESVLRRIGGAAKLSIEETGVNMLYLIFGFLEWYENDDAERPALAPLVLVPAVLRRADDPGTRTYRYYIQYSDEDIVGNVSLQERLKRDFSLDLPEFSEETELAGYYEGLKPLLRGYSRWAIRRRITLGLISFQKLLMYRDLDQRRWPAPGGPLHHSRIREFFEGVARDGFDVAPDYELDSADMRQKIPPLIYDADSSQHSALVDAIAGKSLVIQGPPGTGKSQTITNLVAAAIAGGKNVLFVAEKLAALEVVKRRLDEAGLGAFCLELHSHKAKKKEVLAGIEERAQRRFPDVSGLDEKLQLLEREKVALNHYVETIHRRLGVSEYTIYEGLWAYHRHRTLLSAKMPVLESIRLSSASELTAAGLADLRHALSLFAELLADIEARWESPRLHPWAGVDRSELTFDAERRIVERLGTLAESTNQLLENAAAMPAISPRIVAATAGALRSIADKIGQLSKPGAPFNPLVLSALTQERSTIIAFVDMVDAYQATLRELAPSVAKIGEIDGGTFQTVAAAIAGIQEEVSAQQRLSSIRSNVQILERAVADIGQARHAHEAFSRELRCELPFTLEALCALEASRELLEQAPLEALGLRHPGLSESGAATTLAAAQREAGQLRDVRSRLSATVNIALAPPLHTAQAHAGVVASAGVFAFLRSDYRVARRAFLVMCKVPARPRRSTLRQTYSDLITYLSGVKTFGSHGSYRGVAGPHFASIDTKFDALWALMAWKERLDAELAAFGVPGAALAAAIWSSAPERLKRAASIQLQACDRIEEGLRVAGDFVAGRQLNRASALEVVQDALSGLVRRMSGNLAVLDAYGFGSDLTALELHRLAERLERLAILREKIEAADEVRELLGASFAGCSTATPPLREAVALYDSVDASGLPDEVKDWLVSSDFESRLGILTSWEGEVRRRLDEWRSHFDAFQTESGVDLAAWLRTAAASLDHIELQTFANRAQEALAAPNELQAWAQYSHIRREATNRGLKQLLDAVEAGHISRSELLDAFDLVHFQSLVHIALAGFPILAQFNGLTHEQARRRFAKLDADAMELYRARVAHQASERRIVAGRSVGPVSTYTEAGLLSHEIQKQRRHIPLRQLIARAPRTLQALKPCFMMSPLSVAQYLAPGTIDFHLVVMDEASQLKPEDALGAVLRGAQLVVVGDPMQLPPTTFFERFNSDEEDEEPDESAAGVSDSESILDVAGMLYTPARLLKWHYRSQHGSLIAFSNAEFYANKLIVFPSPVAKSAELGVQFVHVANGVYQAGTNVEEARRVVDGVLRHMRLRSGESLGVVALNLRQREVIEDEFERRLREDVFAQRFLDGHANSAEPFFIKNLENVQGDERDVIFISVTYGADRAGNIYQRFGPITGRQGHRRLNVLFTRAKRRVVVFSSLTADQVKVEPSSSWGIRALKGYLTYAQTGTLGETRFSGREPDSDFEVEVAQTIREARFEVVAQLGVAGFYLDLAVKHPEKPDAFLLGVECDGATYHAARSARDRDRLRQEILERLGWKIHRIWSTDWYRNKEACILRLRRRIDEVLREDADRVRREAIRREAQVDQPVAVVQATETPTPQQSQTEFQDSPITRDEARRLLIAFREHITRRDFPDSDRAKGLLRRGLLESLLEYLPTSMQEWLAWIPEDERQSIDQRQLRYLNDVFKILRRVPR